MAKVISINIQKGGSGKTTTANAISWKLGNDGFNVLLIDLDPQANATFQAGVNDPKLTAYDLLTGKAAVNDVIIKCGKYDLLPSDILLSAADQELSNIGREFLLKKAIAPIMDEYDYIIIDTPPSLGVLSWNALAVADHVVIPLEPSSFAIKGMIQLYDMICRIIETFNPKLKIAGILLVRYQKQTTNGRDIEQTLKQMCEYIGVDLFHTRIRDGVIVKDAQRKQVSIYEVGKKSKVIDDYTNFINELIERLER